MSPLHKGFLKKRIARWLGVTRWDGAIRHLLMRDLTMLSVLPEGEAGNRALRDAFFAMIPVLRPTVFCDIGANDGTAALTVRELAPDCSVYGFEANPSIHAHHAAAMASRGVHWLNIAVSDTSGRLPVFAPRTLSRAYVDGQVVPAEIVEPEHTGKTSLLERAEEATYERFEVQARRLDDVFPRRRGERGERRFFLWIDVEGAADKVLRGAKAVLRDTLALFVEVENHRFWQGQKLASDICDLLYKKNFIPLARDREYADLQFNMLFVNTKVAPLLSSALFDSSSPLRACLASPSRFAASQSAEAPVASRADAAPTKRTYTCVRSFLQSEVPVYVPCYNNPTYTRGMLRQLRELGFRRIILVDNSSTSPDMRIFLSGVQEDAVVINLATNLGPRDIALDTRNLALLPRYFCITDPDLELNRSLPDGFLGDLAGLILRQRVGKAGFALDISDRDAMREESFQIGDWEGKIWEWEEQFWAKPLSPLESGDEVYDAEIDTTFALYDKEYFDPTTFLRAVRVAGRFTARHLPWYRDLGVPDAEVDYYRRTGQFSFYLR